MTWLTRLFVVLLVGLCVRGSWQGPAVGIPVSDPPRSQVNPENFGGGEWPFLSLMKAAANYYYYGGAIGSGPDELNTSGYPLYNSPAVGSGDGTTSPIANINSATIKDAAGNAAHSSLSGVTQTGPYIHQVARVPTISSLVESPSTGNVTTGNSVSLTLNFSTAVRVAGGTPSLTLNSGGTATYASGSGTYALVFKYTVALGESTTSLAATAVNLNSATIKRSGGISANLSLSGLTQTGPSINNVSPPTAMVVSVVKSPSGGRVFTGSSVTLTLNFSQNVTVAGETPSLSLNSGSTVATYASGSGTRALVFDYTVGSGDTANSLAATAVNLNGATIKSNLGVAANLSLSGTTQSGPAVNPFAILSLAESPSTGRVNTGGPVTLTLIFSKTATVAGGTPSLSLNSGGTATYVSGSGGTSLVFGYTVGSGDLTSSLAAYQVNLNGATIVNGSSQNANLSLVGLTQVGPNVNGGPLISAKRSQFNEAGLSAGHGFPFVNLAKGSENFSFSNNKSLGADQLDANGYPLYSAVAANGYAVASMSYPAQFARPGHYVISWTGAGSLAFGEYTGNTATQFACTGTSSGGSGQICGNTTCSPFTGYISDSTLYVTNIPAGQPGTCGLLVQGQPIYNTVGVVSGSYSPSSGLATLRLAANVGIVSGNSVTVANATGTGAFASLNGTFTVQPGSSGTTLIVQLLTNLTMTVAGGSQMSVTSTVVNQWGTPTVISSLTSSSNTNPLSPTCTSGTPCQYGLNFSQTIGSSGNLAQINPGGRAEYALTETGAFQPIRGSWYIYATGTSANQANTVGNVGIYYSCLHSKGTCSPAGIDDEESYWTGVITAPVYKAYIANTMHPGVVRDLGLHDTLNSNMTTWASRKPTSYVTWADDGTEMRQSLWLGTATLDTASALTKGGGVSFTGSQGSSFTASSSGTTALTVSGISGMLLVGDTLSGPGVPSSTIITSQTSGTTGGNGTYTTYPATTLSGTVYGLSYYLNVTAINSGGLRYGTYLTENGATFTANSSGTTTLNVTAMAAGSGPIVLGTMIQGSGVTINPITIIVSQTSGTPGGVGAYVTNQATAVAAGTTLYSGYANTATEIWAMQGPRCPAPSGTAPVITYSGSTQLSAPTPPCTGTGGTGTYRISNNLQFNNQNQWYMPPLTMTSTCQCYYVTLPTYDGTATYAALQSVLYGGNIYVSLQDGNTGNTPSSSPTWWSGGSSTPVDKQHIIFRWPNVGPGYSTYAFSVDGGTTYFPFFGPGGNINLGAPLAGSAKGYSLNINDAVFDSVMWGTGGWLDMGYTTTAWGLDNEVPAEAYVEFANEIGANVWLTGLYMTVDPMTDWTTQYATYIKTNYPNMVPQFETPDEIWNPTNVTNYAGNKSFGWAILDNQTAVVAAQSPSGCNAGPCVIQLVSVPPSLKVGSEVWDISNSFYPISSNSIVTGISGNNITVAQINGAGPIVNGFVAAGDTLGFGWIPAAVGLPSLGPSNWAGKIGSTLCQAVSAVYGEPTSGKYHCGIGVWTTLEAQGFSEHLYGYRRFWSYAYMSQNTANIPIQTGYVQEPGFNWATNLVMETYWQIPELNYPIELSDAYCYFAQATGCDLQATIMQRYIGTADALQANGGWNVSGNLAELNSFWAPWLTEAQSCIGWATPPSWATGNAPWSGFPACSSLPLSTALLMNYEGGGDAPLVGPGTAAETGPKFTNDFTMTLTGVLTNASPCVLSFNFNVSNAYINSDGVSGHTTPGSIMNWTSGSVTFPSPYNGAQHGGYVGSTLTWSGGSGASYPPRWVGYVDGVDVNGSNSGVGWNVSSNTLSTFSQYVAPTTITVSPRVAVAGMPIKISGASPSGYNGYFTVQGTGLAADGTMPINLDCTSLGPMTTPGLVTFIGSGNYVNFLRFMSHTNTSYWPTLMSGILSTWANYGLGNSILTSAQQVNATDYPGYTGVDINGFLAVAFSTSSSISGTTLTLGGAKSSGGTQTTVSGGTYNSTTGVVTMTLANGPNSSPGCIGNISVSGYTGTSAGLNGNFPASWNTCGGSASSVTYYAGTGLSVPAASASWTGTGVVQSISGLFQVGMSVWGPGIPGGIFAPTISSCNQGVGNPGPCGSNAGDQLTISWNCTASCPTSTFVNGGYIGLFGQGAGIADWNTAHYPYLLKRDVDPTSNDNRPAWLDEAA